MKARNKGLLPGSLGINLSKNGSTVTNRNISNISGNTWKYYRVEAQGQSPSFANLTVGAEHEIALTPYSSSRFTD